MSVVVNHPFPHQHPSPNLPTPKHSHSSHDYTVQDLFFLNCVRVSTDLMLYHLECFIVYFLQILQHNHITTIKVKILPSNPQMVFMVCQLSYHSLFTMKRSSSETHRVLYYHVSLVFSLE